MKKLYHSVFSSLQVNIEHDNHTLYTYTHVDHLENNGRFKYRLTKKN
jgi:hypothetical protein